MTKTRQRSLDLLPSDRPARRGSGGKRTDQGTRRVLIFDYQTWLSLTNGLVEKVKFSVEDTGTLPVRGTVRERASRL
jgi:hypothetical protein